MIKYASNKQSNYAIRKSFQEVTGGVLSSCRELNLKKLKFGLSPSPQWLAGAPGGGQCHWLRNWVRSQELSQELTQDLWPSIPFQKTPESCTLGPLKRHNAFWSEFWTSQAGYCTNASQTGGNTRLTWLLTLLSTYVQSLERSIQGSTKLGLAKLCCTHLPRYGLPNSQYHLFSRCLT